MFDRTVISNQAHRKYADYLRSIVTGDSFFPMKLVLGKSRRSDTYEARRAELAEIRAASAELGFEVTWVPVADPRFGTHERPEAASFTNEQAFLVAVQKQSEVANFKKDIMFILAQYPQLRLWAASRAQQIVANHGRWPRLLRVVTWLLAHEKCGLYLRQLPIQGVDTKFIERNHRLLDELLIELDAKRGEAEFQTFHQRHGLREEESRVRIRFLDSLLRESCGLPEFADDLELPLSEASNLTLQHSTVFITENLRNFLALPPHPFSVVVLGHGDASARLYTLKWLARASVYYWGDLDAHGFGILARLRSFAPHAASFLMDAATLEANYEFAVEDPTASPSVNSLHLNEEEQATYRMLAEGKVRLEQERISIDYVHRKMKTLQ